MFNAARLARMKPTAYLVNTARGGIIDEPALHAALSTGKLAGAGLDVYEQEPVQPDNPLLKLANVVSAPHMAGVTKELLDRMGLQTAQEHPERARRQADPRERDQPGSAGLAGHPGACRRDPSVPHASERADRWIPGTRTGMITIGRYKWNCA